MNNTLTPSIYVACLAAYNNGILHGTWIDATIDCNDIMREVSKMLAKSPIANAEEWAIHDYSDFGQIILSDYTSIAEANRLATLIAQYGESFACFAAYVGNEYATDDNFHDAYQGSWSDETKFAQELFDELYDLPPPVCYYVDYESFSRDLFVNDYFSEWSSSGGVHVFRNI